MTAKVTGSVLVFIIPFVTLAVFCGVLALPAGGFPGWYFSRNLDA